jgi:CheY-like chemotaxis protein
VISDVVMPRMGGRELAERLALERPKAKVLFVSGYTADIIARQGVLEEGVRLLHKPFTPDALLLKVADVLGTPLPLTLESEALVTL